MNWLPKRWKLIVLTLVIMIGFTWAFFDVAREKYIGVEEIFGCSYDAQTTAHVLATRESPGERDKCTIWYEFTVDGKTYKGPTNSGRRLYQECSYFKGKDIEVAYNSADPTQNEWKSNGAAPHPLLVVVVAAIPVGVMTSLRIFGGLHNVFGFFEQLHRGETSKE